MGMPFVQRRIVIGGAGVDRGRISDHLGVLVAEYLRHTLGRIAM
jgi:hypothetical protein